jgi:CRISPR/Cas system-associated endonuclease Cas1
MTVSDLLQQIRKNLEKRRLEIAEDMVDGRMTDINAYHKNVGISEGLMQASEVIRETIKNINEEDE